MQVLTQFLPLGICQVWGKEVLATPEGIALRLETFMLANENKRPTMWPHDPVEPIAQEHLLSSLSKSGPFFITSIHNLMIISSYVVCSKMTTIYSFKSYAIILIFMNLNTLLFYTSISLGGGGSLIIIIIM